jgi:hypothetical protein
MSVLDAKVSDQHQQTMLAIANLANYPPGFLWGSVESTKFMRLSSEKAAHATMNGAACRKSGSSGIGTSGETREPYQSVTQG